MSRRLLLSCLVLLSCLLWLSRTAVVGQSGPLAPGALDPATTAAIAQYAQTAGYPYVGDCQTVDATSAGQVCSLAFAQDDGSTLVQFFTVGDDGSTVQPAIDTFSLPAAPAVVSTPSATPAATPMPTATPVPTAAPVTFVYGGGVAPDDRDAIESGVHLGAQAYGIQDGATVYSYRDLGQFFQQYAQVVCGGCRLSQDTQQRLSRNCAESGAGYVFILVSSPCWQSGWQPLRTDHAKIAAHEYFHTVQGALSGKANPSDAGPLWLVEGSAEYEGFQALDSGGLLGYTAGGRDTMLAGLSSTSVHLSALETLQQADAANGGAAIYPVGALAVEYLVSLAGPGSVQQYFAAVRTTAWQQAFQATFGLAVGDFYPRFENYRAAQLATPPTITFVGTEPANSRPTATPGHTLYEFLVAGTSPNLGQAQLRVLAPDGTQVNTPRGQLPDNGGRKVYIVFLSPVPPGTYTLVVALAGGPQVQATFPVTQSQ